MSVANIFKSVSIWFANLFKTTEEIEKGVLEDELKEIMERKNEEEEERGKQEREDGRFL